MTLNVNQIVAARCANAGLTFDGVMALTPLIVEKLSEQLPELKFVPSEGFLSAIVDSMITAILIAYEEQTYNRPISVH